MYSLTTAIFSAFEWVIRIAKLNLIWLAASVLGLVVFTVFPATVAAFAVTNEWVKGNGDVSIWRTFKDAFTKYFWRSQLIGYSLVAAYFILIVDIRLFLSMNNQTFTQAIVIILAVLLFLLIIVNLYIFPLMLEGERKLIDTIKYAFFTGVSYIHWTLINVLGVIAISLVTLRYPAVSIFLSFAGIMLWLTCMNQIVKRKIETKYEKLHSTME